MLNSCSICLNDITEKIITPCGHTFCNKCLTQWLLKDDNVSCPCCRYKFGIINHNDSNRLIKVRINTDIKSYFNRNESINHPLPNIDILMWRWGRSIYGPTIFGGKIIELLEELIDYYYCDNTFISWNTYNYPFDNYFDYNLKKKKYIYKIHAKIIKYNIYVTIKCKKLRYYDNNNINFKWKFKRPLYTTNIKLK